MKPLKEGSLFSGYNGLGLGLSQVLDTELAWVSDIDKGACKILAHRYPDVPNHGDLTAIDWSAVEPVDIITGGFPCQDLSHAGKGAGMAEGTRSGLWAYMAEAINIIRPRLVVAENVRGLLSAEALRPVEPCTWCVGDEPVFDVRALGAVLADLADIGYDASWYGLRAADVGACHGRFRVFLVAHPRGLSEREHAGEPLAAKAGPDGGYESGSSSGRRTAGLTLLPTPDASPEKYRLGGRSQQSNSLPAMAIRGELMPTPRASRGSSGTETMYALGAVRSDESRPQGEVLLPTPSVADADGGHATRSGDRSGELLLPGVARTFPPPRYAVLDAERRFGEYAEAIKGWERATGREAPDPTEPTGRNDSHRLSPRFVEWMMGLQAGWITDVPGITRNEALKACGNGVVPQQAAAALRVLLTAQEVAA